MPNFNMVTGELIPDTVFSMVPAFANKGDKFPIKNAGLKKKVNAKQVVSAQTIDVDSDLYFKDKSMKPQAQTEPLSGNLVAKEVLDVGPKLEGTGTSPAEIKHQKTPFEEMNDRDKQFNKGMMIAAGANFVLEVMNANSAYQNVQGQAALNILQARNQANDAIYRGRQARMDAESEGKNNSEEAILSMVAQGQRVDSAGVQKISKSYEIMGAMNGMREEINSMREALGYELEEINYDYQVDSAKETRNFALIGSALNFGANYYAYGSK
jgi:hypothetical protein